MNSYFAMFLVLGIFVIAASIQTTYAQTEDDASSNYLYYENNAIGVNLQYPDDWILVEDIPIHLTLVSTPKLDEEGEQDAKGVVERICPIGTHVLVDQDNLHQSDGFTADARVLAVVYCNGFNINEILVHRGLGSFESTYCHASEFADESWAKEGCSE